MKENKKNISRKNFLKGAACLTLCPFILANLNSCGDGKGTTEEGEEHKIASSKYSSMKSGESISLDLEGFKKGIILHKKSENEFVAFNATCPHMQYKVASNGVCEGHGGQFELNDSGQGLNSVVNGMKLLKYDVTIEGDNLILKT